jgi:Xaa-Pro aminopeptidase
LRGIKNPFTAPHFATLHYSKTYHAELVVGLLESMKGRAVGFVGIGMIPPPFHDFVQKKLPAARFTDAKALIDNIKPIKGDEEIALLKRMAASHDTAFEEALKAIRAGKRDFEIAALVQHIAQRLGSEQQLTIAGSAPLGSRCRMLKRHFMNREIKKGDQFTLLIEVKGFCGLCAELVRTCVLGKASEEVLEACEIGKEAQQAKLDLI